MSLDPGLDDKHYCAKSVHEMGGNHCEKYEDSCGVGISTPAALVLNQHDNAHQITFPFSFEYLCDSININHPGNENLLKIIESLCPTNLDEFEADGCSLIFFPHA